MYRTRLVDFCNQNNPRAQPCDHSIPGTYERHNASSLRWTWRTLRDGLRPIPSRRPLPPSSIHSRLPEPTLRLSHGKLGRIPAEFVRVRGRLTFVTRRLQRRAREHHDGASPRNDSLGHLLSRNRAGVERRTQRRLLPSQAAQQGSNDLVPQASPRAQTHRLRPTWPPRGPLTRGRRSEEAPYNPLARTPDAHPDRSHQNAYAT